MKTGYETIEELITLSSEGFENEWTLTKRNKRPFVSKTKTPAKETPTKSKVEKPFDPDGLIRVTD